VVYKNLEKLRSFLDKKTGLAYFNGSHSELICRCPSCEPDSKRRHGHLYISTHEPLFNCFKCNYKGLVTKLLRLLDENPEDYLYLDKIKIKNSEFSLNRPIFEVKTYDIPEDTKLSKIKRAYLKTRLGVDLDEAKVPNLIIDLERFININNLSIPDSVLGLYPYLCENFIGFLCNRGTLIILRNVDCNAKISHFRLKIGEIGIFSDFYGLKIGPRRPNLNKIVLCEGIFDVLSSKSRTELDNILGGTHFLSAVLGRHYYNTFTSILDYCKLTMADVVILGDNDVPIKEYDFIRNHPSVVGFNLYINKIGHDFATKNIEPLKVVTGKPNRRV